MPEVNITDADLIAKARNGADLSKEERARVAQLEGWSPGREIEPDQGKEILPPNTRVARRGRPKKATS